MEEVLLRILNTSQQFIKGEWETRCEAGKTCFANIEQHPTHCSSGQFVSPLDTHATVFDFKSKRILHPFELLGGFGLNMYHNGRPQKDVTALRPVFEGLTLNQTKLLTGNAIHIPTVVTWVAYVIGHLVARTERSIDELALQPHVDDESDVDSDSD